MYAKIIALGLVSSLVAIDAGRDWLRRAPEDPLQAPQLTPQTIGAWQQTARGIYSRGTGQFQEYAQYEYAGFLVTLSFDHNRLYRHNAVDCFLVRGEPIESSTVRSLKTLDGSARFNLARFDDSNSISLVAASQCMAQGCIENPPAPGWADLGRLSFWKESLFRPGYHAIPINISMTGSAAQRQDYSTMEQALADFVANLDLTPARRQAQRESGLEQ